MEKAEPTRHIVCGLPTIYPPFENEVITRNPYSWIAMLVMGLTEKITVVVSFRTLFHAWRQNEPLLLDTFIHLVLALLMGIFYFFLAFKKCYLLTGNVPLRLAPIAILGTIGALFDKFYLGLANDEVLLGICLDLAMYILLVFIKAARPYKYEFLDDIP